MPNSITSLQKSFIVAQTRGKQPFIFPYFYLCSRRVHLYPVPSSHPSFNIIPASGERGVSGLDGKEGRYGERGYDGLDGRPGQPGEEGEVGTPGVPGDSGEPGYPGLPGILVMNNLTINHVICSSSNTFFLSNTIDVLVTLYESHSFHIFVASAVSTGT